MQAGAVHVHALGGEEHVDRPVPEVEAIADRAYEGQRSKRQRARHDAARADHRAHDEDQRGELRQPEPSVVEEGVLAAQRAPRDAEADRRDDAAHVELGARVPVVNAAFAGRTAARAAPARMPVARVSVPR